MASYDTGRFLAERIAQLGPFELICDSDPRPGIPAVAWRMVEGADPGYSLYDLADRLRLKGWQVPAYPLTGSVADVAVQRDPRPPGGPPRPPPRSCSTTWRTAIAHFLAVVTGKVVGSGCASEPSATPAATPYLGADRLNDASGRGSSRDTGCPFAGHP